MLLNKRLKKRIFEWNLTQFILKNWKKNIKVQFEILSGLYAKIYFKKIKNNSNLFLFLVLCDKLKDKDRLIEEIKEHNNQLLKQLANDSGYGE